jgi:hypothetical protein
MNELAACVAAFVAGIAVMITVFAIFETVSDWLYSRRKP